MNIQSVHIEKGDILVVHGNFNKKTQRLIEARFRAAFEAVGIEDVVVVFVPSEIRFSVLKKPETSVSVSNL